jgi:hypothetical protein
MSLIACIERELKAMYYRLCPSNTKRLLKCQLERFCKNSTILESEWLAARSNNEVIRYCLRKSVSYLIGCLAGSNSGLKKRCVDTSGLRDNDKPKTKRIYHPGDQTKST